MPILSLESEQIATSLRQCAQLLHIRLAKRAGLASVLNTLNALGATVRLEDGQWWVTLNRNTVSAWVNGVGAHHRVTPPDARQLELELELEPPTFPSDTVPLEPLTFIYDIQSSSD